jgi:hypothetical protein
MHNRAAEEFSVPPARKPLIAQISGSAALDTIHRLQLSWLDALCDRPLDGDAEVTTGTAGIRSKG